MISNASLGELAAILTHDLKAAYGTLDGRSIQGGQPLVEAFAAFAKSARDARMTLEDVMAASVDTLQELFEQFGSGAAADPATIRAAGIALATVSRVFHETPPTEHDGSGIISDPLPAQMSRLSALHQINRAATANLSLPDMLQQIASIVTEAADGDACSIFMYNDGTGLLTLRAGVGLSPVSVGSATLRLGFGITGLAASEQKLIAAPDAHEHESFLAHPGIGDEIYTSQVSVPITSKGESKLVGILNIYSIRRREYSDDELEFLQTVAGELAISIENTRQFSQTDERLRRKVAELGTLQRVSRMLASTLDLADVLRLITEQAMELVHADAAAIFRIRETTNAGRRDAVPTIEYRVGPVREMIDDADRDRVVAQVLLTGTAKRDEISFVDGVSTLFCLPLRSARETVGAICLRLRPSVEVDEDTLGILQAFSDSAAMAIENAQLYQDAMHSIQTQSALVQEMHHRVRNNLQTVAALLSLQLRSAEDAPWATEIREAISRIQSIAAVHDLLSDEKRLAGTTVDVIARMVAEDAHSTLIPPGIQVRFDIQTSTLTVASRQATILSLLINELTANAISHGFRNRDHGYVRIRAWEDDGMANVEVFNDGHRVPEGFDPARSEGLGMRITQRLVTSDLKGTFSIMSGPNGTTALMHFPIAEDNWNE
jgi:two-component sensor histidine kinase/putative methionine-R-sulfoxide reductase with GAF domain